MTKSVRSKKTTGKLIPYALLILEIMAFYGGTGWLFGIWKEDRDNFQLLVLLAYIFGVFTFIFFIFTIPPQLIRKSFIITTTIFALTAFPCFFLSLVLMNALHQEQPIYTQLLAEQWKHTLSILSNFTFHILSFIIALSLQKFIKNF